MEIKAAIGDLGLTVRGEVAAGGKAKGSLSDSETPTEMRGCVKTQIEITG